MEDTLDNEVETLNVTDGEDNGNGEEDRGDELPGDKPDPAAADEAAKADEPAAKTEEDEDPATRQPGNRMVPITRFNEVNDQMKELRAQNQQLLAALSAGKPAEADKPEPAVDIDKALQEKRAQYHTLLMAGDENKASSLMAEIDQLVEDRATERALARMEQREQERQAERTRQTFAETAAEIVANFPALDVSSAEANHEAIRYVVTERDHLLAAGKAPADALRQASDRAAKLFGLGEQPPHTKPPASDNRAISAATRNAKAAQDQPAMAAGVGDRATAAPRQDVGAMTDAEFDALPETEKARLRGD